MAVNRSVKPAAMLGFAGVTAIDCRTAAVTVIVVISLKAWTGRGTPLRGGLPSGHSALAFAAWIAATYAAGQSHRFLVSSIAFVMALLVAQTRVESGVHSSTEVALGGLLGTLTSLALFQLAG